MRLLKRAGLVYVGSRGSLAGRIVDVGDTPEKVATFLQEAAQEMAVNLRAEGQELPLSAVIIRRLSVA